MVHAKTRQIAFTAKHCLNRGSLSTVCVLGRVGLLMLQFNSIQFNLFAIIHEKQNMKII